MRKCKKCKIKLPANAEGILCNTCRLTPKTAGTPEQIDASQTYFTAKNLAEQANRWQDSQTTYDLLWPQVLELRKIQGGRCAICGRKLYLVLDHDHRTNKARGYLCRGCNTKLSGFDNPVFVAQANEYLKNPPANIVRISEKIPE